MRKLLLSFFVLLALLIGILLGRWFSLSYRIQDIFLALSGGPSMSFSRIPCKSAGGTAQCDEKNIGSPVKTAWSANGTFEAIGITHIQCASFKSIVGTYALHGDSLVLQYVEHSINPMFCAFPQELRYSFKNLPKKEYRVTMQRL